MLFCEGFFDGAGGAVSSSSVYHASSGLQYNIIIATSIGCVGHSMYIPHALLLRGTLYSLWREDKKALKDLQEIVNTREQDKEVGRANYWNEMWSLICV